MCSADAAVKSFMVSLRQPLPTVNISLKRHFLEDHVMPQIHHLKAGLCKMNEQGGENVHSKPNKAKTTISNMSNQPLIHLMTVMTNTITAALPDVQS